MSTKQAPHTMHQFVTDVWRFVSPFKWAFIGATLLRLTSDITQLFGPWALSQIINQLAIEIPTSIASFVDVFGVLLIIWFFAGAYNAIGRGFAKIIGFRVAEQASLSAMKETVGHIFNLDLDWQEQKHSGDKLKRVNRGRDGINMLLRDYYNMMIEIVVVIVANVAVFATLDAVIGGVIGFFMVTFYAMSFYMTKRGSEQEYIVNKAEEKLESINFESLNNIKTVKSLAIAQPLVRQLKAAAHQVYLKVRKRIFLFQGRTLLLNLYFFVFKFSIICYLLFQVIQGQTELGIIVLFMTYFDKLGSAIWELSDVTQKTVVYKIWIERMMSILHTKPTINEFETGQTPYPQDWQELQLDQLKFTYPDKAALKNITTTIKRGQSIGIVGLSGAGKSTLFKLLMDLYEHYQGTISFDGVELKDMNRKSYINHTAVVLQETEMFNMSLRDNIMLAKRSDQKEDEQLLQQVLKMAHLEDVVDRLPEGLDTIVGEKGMRLSGGERQRIGIARALYRQPDILLMDEATSHLDIYSEKYIQQSLAEFFKQVTAIVIAHRLPTVKRMDRILVLENGKIAEDGSFKQLMEKNGLFAKMWNEQKL